MGALVTYEWNTPVTQIPASTSGRFHILKREAPAGISWDTGNASGISEVLFTKAVTFTQLKDTPNQDAIPWMSDTPMEYYKTNDLVTRTKGSRVLVGGLGLGLITHLLANREDIKEIVVIELEPDVIALVKDYLPAKVKVIEGDFLLKLSEFEGEHFDTIIADIWKTGFEPEDKELFEECRMAMEDFHSEATHLFWAFQESIDDNNLYMAVHYLNHQGVKIRTFED
jgi:threonine dehydrogenase-like Zn-dependent dehydrogenase